MFGFLKTLFVEDKVKAPKRNIKVEGRPMINASYLVDALTGNRPLNLPVGREVVNGEWFTLFVATRKDDSIIRNKNGEVCLNRR